MKPTDFIERNAILLSPLGAGDVLEAKLEGTPVSHPIRKDLATGLNAR